MNTSAGLVLGALASESEPLQAATDEQLASRLSFVNNPLKRSSAG
jgi:hypothetical protein